MTMIFKNQDNHGNQANQENRQTMIGNPANQEIQIKAINQGNQVIRKIKVKTMPHDQAYLQAEKKIEEARRVK